MRGVSSTDLLWRSCHAPSNFTDNMNCQIEVSMNYIYYTVVTPSPIAVKVEVKNNIVQMHVIMQRINASAHS
jgi:hypothetical protein